jgi:hypothetical protein
MATAAAAVMGGDSLAGLIIVVCVLALVGTTMCKRQPSEPSALPNVNAKTSSFLKNDSFSKVLSSEEGVSNPCTTHNIGRQRSYVLGHPGVQLEQTPTVRCTMRLH